jgi:muramidase (phage lysozyme)
MQVVMEISKNLRAFLQMLKFSEGTSTSSITVNDGYDVIVTGADKVPEVFTDYSDHPFNNGRPSKVINSRGLTSNASGAYQFMLKDWAHYKALLNLPDFGPESQDKWCVQLIRERGALSKIEAGLITDAISKCRNLWASLPAAGYGQHEQSLKLLLLKYQQFGGVLTA